MWFIAVELNLPSWMASQPEWLQIVKLCSNKITKRYEKYGNSWVDNYEFDWINRLYGEVTELILKPVDDIDGRIDELTDIINIASMMLTNELKLKQNP